MVCLTAISLKAWERFLNAGVPTAIRTSTKSLGLASKWLDEGIELTFEALEDGVRIKNKNGGEVGRIIKEGLDEFLEIGDDFFVDVPISAAKPINDLPVRAPTGDGESFISPGFVRNADGTIGFVEDVSSYGSNLVQKAIKGRGDLRKGMPNILSAEEAHHFIPVQLLKENNVVKMAVEAGFKFNDPLVNGVALTKFRKATGQGRHGPHPQYTAQINEVFTKLGNQGVQLSPMQAKQLMKNLVDGNSKYQGIRNIINTTSDKINALDLKLSNINVLDLLGS